MRLFLKPSPVVLVSHFYQTFTQFHAPHRWVNAPRIQAEWAKNVVRVSWTFHQRYLRLAKQIVATILDITDETAGVNSNEWALSLQTGMNMGSYWIATQSKNWTNNEAPHHFAKKKKKSKGGGVLQFLNCGSGLQCSEATIAGRIFTEGLTGWLSIWPYYSGMAASTL